MTLNCRSSSFTLLWCNIYRLVTLNNIVNCFWIFTWPICILSCCILPWFFLVQVLLLNIRYWARAISIYHMWLFSIVELLIISLLLLLLLLDEFLKPVKKNRKFFPHWWIFLFKAEKFRSHVLVFILKRAERRLSLVPFY
jgi:hypothetical protein